MTDRPKQHGGARQGAGRPIREPELITLPYCADPLVFLLALVNEQAADMRLRVAAAAAALPYVHSKKVEGVKDEKQTAAKKASAGKFGPSSPPVRLVR